MECAEDCGVGNEYKSVPCCVKCRNGHNQLHSLISPISAFASIRVGPELKWIMTNKRRLGCRTHVAGKSAAI